MRKRPVKIIGSLFLALMVVVLIVDYFNRQSSTLPDMGGTKKGDKSISPFRWNMDDAEEIDSYSESVKEFYFKDGKAFILFNEILYIAPQQKGKMIDLERFTNFAISFYSKNSAMMVIRLFVQSDEKKSVDLVSENILVHMGWNRLSLNFRDLTFYEKIQNQKNQFDLTKHKVMVHQMRFDFINNVPEDSYLLLDFIRLNQAGRFDLLASDFGIWGDGRNVKKTGSYLEQSDKSLPMEVSIAPIGFDSAVRKIYIIVYPQTDNSQISLYYRLYDMLEDPTVIDPDAREWMITAADKGGAEINTGAASMVELRLFFPAGAQKKPIRIEKVQIFFERDLYAELHYPLLGFMIAPYASGSKYETETVRFPLSGYWISDLKLDPACFDEINLSLAKGYLIVGRVDGDLQKSIISDTVRVFKDLVSIWAVRSNVGRFEDVKKIIEEYEPDAQVINLGNQSNFIYSENKRDIEEKLKQLPHSYIKLDRGPVFFSGIVLILFLILLVLQKKIDISLTFKASHLKWFGICLIASVVLLAPLVFALGLGSYRYVTFSEIMNAFYRYGVSAFLQELLRAVAIEYTVILAFKKIKNTDKKYLAALLLTSIFFSLGHLGYPGLDAEKGLSFLFITFIAGLIFGFLYIRTRSLLPVSILHFISNLFLFVFTTM